MVKLYVFFILKPFNFSRLIVQSTTKKNAWLFKPMFGSNVDNPNHWV